MTSQIDPIATATHIPPSSATVIIGGGIVGLTAALVLSERGIPVTLVEKGKLVAEQSSRNQGWIRKTNRSPADMPMALVSDRLWRGMAERVGADVGYREAGILFLARTEAEMAAHGAWLKSAGSLSPDSRLVTPSEIETLAPGGRSAWAGGLYTPSDGRAEPSQAASAIANAAARNGAILVENCAARALSMKGGRVSGVVTEAGEIRCGRVLLAGGLWSRRFLGNHGVSLPTLPLILSALRTAPLDGPCEIAVGGPDFSFRKRADGGFTISQRGSLKAPLTLDHLLLGRHFLPALRAQRHALNISLGRDFLADISLSRRWKPTHRSPFERVRTMSPPFDAPVGAEALRNVAAAWPAFAHATIVEGWAGAMDMTPDSLPIMGPVAALPGLTLATGFSGHGFGTAPCAGQLAADLMTDAEPIIDPSPYRLGRFR